MSRFASVAVLYDRLLASAPDTLRAWLDESSGQHRFALRSRIEAARHVATAESAGWSLDRAIEWINERARSLVDTTVFEGDKMIKDETGASGSTFTPLQNYLSMGVDAPLPVHSDALELLRVHSRAQMDRAEFDHAYAAVRAAMRAEGLEMAPEGSRPYIPHGQRAERLTGGGAYNLNTARGEIEITTGKSVAVASLIRRLGRDVVRYRAPTQGDFTIIVEPSRAEEFAAGLRTIKFTELADTIDTLAPYWRRTLGTPAAAPVVHAADAQSAEAGTVRAERTRWVWDPAAFTIRLYGPERAVNVVRRLPHGKAERDPAAASFEESYYVAIPTRAEMLDSTLTALAAVYPQTAAAMRAFMPAWTAVRSALKQSREEGTSDDGGRWKLIAVPRSMAPGSDVIEYLRVWTPYLKDGDGNQIRWWRTVPSADNRQRDGERAWSVQVQVKRVGKLVEALRPHMPRLAEAISRAFGGVAGVVDEELEACAARIDMHDKVSPADVTNADALDAIERVRHAFNVRAPAGLRPLPFQLVGIAFAQQAGYRALIADAPGLGKTIQGLGCILTDPEMLLPAVFVVPTNVLYNWRDEAAKWLPSVPLHLLDTKRSPLPPTGWKGIILTTWDTMVEHATALAAWGVRFLLADEAHYGKNPKAQRTKSLRALADAIPHVILLTGTPIKNTVLELHTLLEMLDPGTWGTKKAFEQAYSADTEAGKGKGAKDVDALRARLACVRVRRLKEDALKDLPKKTRRYFDVPLTREQRREYRRIQAEFETWLEAELTKRIFAELTAQGIDPAHASATAREEASARAEKALRAQILVKMGAMRQFVGGTKTPAAINLAKQLVEHGESVVLFAQHKPVVQGIAAALKAAGIRYGVIDGAASAEDRSAITRAFQAGQIQAIVASQAAKEGLTLTRAANTIFVERYWTPADEQQAEDRIHRIGQTRPVVITYLHAPNTIDDKMRNLIDAKRDLVQTVLGDDDIEEADRTGSEDALIHELITGRGQAPALPDADEDTDEDTEDEDEPRANPRALSAAFRALAASTPPRPRVPRRSEVQALLFDRRAWTVKTARHWATVNGYTASDLNETGRYLLLTQRDSDDYVPGSFKTAPLLSSIHAITGRLRRT